MATQATLQWVSTIPERCRVCYTCVRECPAKAIRITAHQAKIIPERCIACGNCVRVCSQHAKQVVSSVDRVFHLLASGQPAAAMVAPSFPAEFAETDHRHVVGMLRALGFHHVHEVAFGADLVALRYRRLLQETEGHYISTACPAVVSYVEKYFPDLIPRLAPIASPMVASARALRELHGPGVKTVFIGPCVAKKVEAGKGGSGVDEVLTFIELRELLRRQGVEPGSVTPSDFDPPRGGLGALYPIARGMLQAAGISEDLQKGDVVAADGRHDFQEAIKEFQSADLDARLLELLCCNGCIMGSGMSCTAPLFRRRARVSRYVRTRGGGPGAREAAETARRFGALDLSFTFRADDQRLSPPSGDDIAAIMTRMGKLAPKDELNCGACGYDTCIEHAVAIYTGFAENEMCLPNTIDELRRAVAELAETNSQLASTQQALMHSERLASMGQLAAGIAHEVNNPLGVVLLYAHALLEEAASESPLKSDLAMIVTEADRCKKIVSGLLNFARQNKVFRQETDVEDLVAQAIKTIPLPEGVRLRVVHERPGLKADLDRDQMVQVLSNLVKNAYEAMPQGGLLTVTTGSAGAWASLSVSDTGTGIPPDDLHKIYTPFFTTKPIGRGTGLGLPVTYGIVKMHRGDIQVKTNADAATGPTGTTFKVMIPLHGGGD